MATAEQTRLAYLQAMGIQAWSLRVEPPFFDASLATEEKIHSPLPVGEGLGVRACEADSNNESSQEPVTESYHSNLLPTGEESGERACEADSNNELAQESVTDNLKSLPAGEEVFTPPSCNWDDLQAQVQACTRCPLHETRTQTVFGVGDRQADWMAIGEAPGEQEDLQGEPFVGRAGLLLNEMLRGIGLLREQVFIANILKCRPPKNRDPQPAEAAACEDYLKQQLALVKPKIILAVGRIAAQNLLKTTEALGKLRGKVHDYRGVPLVVVYHPAYLLRSPLEKRAAFDDLRLALQTYRKIIKP